ncbi:MAG TPA: acyltransferase [Gemmatimonadales bacterium]|nr:acyltransferase [Gemmatimonadales bacterium]
MTAASRVPADLPPSARPSERPSALRIPTLDGVRGLAILLVLCGHLLVLPATGLLTTLLAHLARIGWIGVDLFFVLSGFLITGILVDTKGDHGYFRSFYLRRALRIFPLYYVFLAVLTAVAFWAAPAHAPARELLARIGWYWTYTVNILVARAGTWDVAPMNTLHLWSLAVEEQFYLVWPFLVWLTPRRWLGRVCVGALALSFVLRVGLRLAGAPAVALYALTITHLDPLALGGLAALVVRAPGGLARLRRWLPGMAAGSAAGIGAIVLTARGVAPKDTAAMQTIGYPVLACFCVALVVSALGAALGARREAPAHGRLERGVLALWACAPLRYLGRRSYAIYLLHFPILYAATLAGFTVPRLVGVGEPPLVAQAIFFATILAVTLLVSEASWRWLETPMLRLKRRFETRPLETRPLETRPRTEAALTIAPAPVRPGRPTPLPSP